MYARQLIGLPFAILGTLCAAFSYAFAKFSDGLWWLTSSIADEVFDA